MKESFSLDQCCQISLDIMHLLYILSLIRLQININYLPFTFNLLLGISLHLIRHTQTHIWFQDIDILVNVDNSPLKILISLEMIYEIERLAMIWPIASPYAVVVSIFPSNFHPYYHYARVVYHHEVFLQ